MKKTGGLVYLISIIIAAAAVALFLQLLQPSAAPINWVIRIAALTGYFCIFGAIVTSAYLRQMARWFGRPFIKIHHILSIVGLSMVTIHPLTVAWRALDLRVFIPAVNSWYAFFSLGGRAAWYLLGIGALAAVLRRTIGKRWKLLHILNYLAFCLATVHGILIGPNVQNWAMRVVFGAMALIVLGVFVQKRARARR